MSPSPSVGRMVPGEGGRKRGGKEGGKRERRLL